MPRRHNPLQPVEPPRQAPAPARRRWVTLALAAALAASTVAAYAAVGGHEFVNYDDPDYVTENRHVRAGLTAEGVRWAFRSTEAGNWFPLTWLSHMADVELFGLAPGGHHLTSLAIHTATTVLLFLVLAGLTGARWPSAFVAALFGLHPLHVESVAWIAERKDVLVGFFWVLTMGAWAHYARRPSPVRYALVILPFALGLMSKAMIVTLPVVLLILDVWPLGRLAAGRTPRRLVVDKLPLAALAGAVAVVTFVAQRGAGAVSSIEFVPVGTRLANAAVSAVLYLRDMAWPSGLAVFYPFPADLRVWQALAAAAALAGVTVWAWRLRRRHPYVLAGWLWYGVTLLPVIGLVQIGAQARADRYTYLPSIGVFLAAAWGLREAWRRMPALRAPLVAGAAAACATLGVATAAQVSYWRTTDTLFERAIAVTDGNYVAHNNLGLALRERDRLDEARIHYERALAIRPTHAAALNNLGELLIELDQPERALESLEASRRLDPDSDDTEVNRATALHRAGRVDEAIEAYRAAARRWPDRAAPHDGLGVALARLGRHDAALAELRLAVALEPDYPDAHYNLGRLLTSLGRHEEARRHLREAIRLDPLFEEAHFNLGTLLAAEGRLAEAAEAFRGAIRARPGYARAHVNLGSALANLGQLDEAIRQFEEAIRLDGSLQEARVNLEYARALRANQPRR